MNIADAEVFRPKLEALLSAHSPRPVDLVFVESVAKWCEEHGGSCPKDPPAMAVVDGPAGNWRVLLRRSIDENEIVGILSRMFVVGFRNCYEILYDTEQFLKHLILHELAHLANDWPQDRENNCDRWAFDKLSARAN